ncbi:MAG: CoA pyrophosphatase [Gammaproteobacteria bacterium]|nr:CoA pyrophosphatase [Gammaproteobacteria bacterium]
MLDLIKERLAVYETGPLAPAYLEQREQAAVLIPVVASREPDLLLTLRPTAMNAHGGEVAWPGGRQDPGDRTLLHTALRETEEELGIGSRHIEIVGELRPFISKYGLLVTPFVGIVEEPVDLVPNPCEIEAVFAVPMAYLAEDPRSSTDVIERHGERHNVPVYHFDGYKIWGLTAMILREFLNEAAGATME